MSIHFQRDLEVLNRELLAVGSIVEEAINKAIAALVDRRDDLAHEVIEGDRRIDDKEVAMEEECLKILALHQPVARDLRFVVTVMKVNNDLERMGDYAVNIAERVTYLANRDPIHLPLDIGRTAELARAMVRDSLDSLVNLDVKLANSVLLRDNEVDEAHRDMFVAVQSLMIQDPKTIKRAIHLLSVSRYLERIADLATNVAEDVIFLAEGQVIRHHHERIESSS
jgi:phosphate transport system protein